MSNLNRLNGNSHPNTQQSDTINSQPFDNYLDESYEESYVTDLEEQDAWEDNSYPILTASEYKQELSEQLKQVRSDASLSSTEKNQLTLQINKLLLGLKGVSNSSTPPARILAELESLQLEMEELGTASQEVGDDWEGTDESDKTEAKKTLDELKTRLQKHDGSFEHLSQSKVDEYIIKIDFMLNDLEKDRGNIDDAFASAEEIEAEAAELGAYPAGVTELADTAGIDREEVVAAAKKYDINLDNPPKPLNKTFIEFLSDLSPELKDSLEAVKSSIVTRNEEITKNINIAKSQNDRNKNSTTNDTDNMDLSAWQNLYDFKWHQSVKDQEVIDAIKNAKDVLINLAKVFYPDEKITIPADQGGSGYEVKHQNYLQADLLEFNGQKLDLFSDLTGELLVSNSEDKEQGFEIPTIEYDWDGTGDWEDFIGRPAVNTYDGSSVNRHSYDNGGFQSSSWNPANWF